MGGVRLISSARIRLAKIGPGTNWNSRSPPPAGLEDFRADDVGGHQVRGELDALELEAEDAAEGGDEQGLGQAGHADEQAVALAEQGGEELLDDLVLADDDAGGFGADGGGAFLDVVPNGRRVRGLDHGSGSRSGAVVEFRDVFAGEDREVDVEGVQPLVREDPGELLERFERVGVLVDGDRDGFATLPFPRGVGLVDAQDGDRGGIGGVALHDGDGGAVQVGDVFAFAHAVSGHGAAADAESQRRGVEPDEGAGPFPVVGEGGVDEFFEQGGIDGDSGSETEGGGQVPAGLLESGVEVGIDAGDAGAQGNEGSRRLRVGGILGPLVPGGAFVGGKACG